VDSVLQLGETMKGVGSVSDGLDVLAEDLVVEIRGVLEGDVPVRPGRVFDLDKLLKALEGFLEAQK